MISSGKPPWLAWFAVTLSCMSVTAAEHLSLFSLLGGGPPKMTSIAQRPAGGEVSHPALPYKWKCLAITIHWEELHSLLARCL